MKLAKMGGALSAALVLALAGESALAQAKIRLEPFVTGVNAPLAMVQVPGENRFFVIEQWGRVRVIDNGKLRPAPLLDIRSKIHKPLHHDFDERGLLGIALHPKFKENGKFYVAYSHHLDFGSDLAQMLWYSHTNVVEEYTVSKSDRNQAEVASVRRLTAIGWPQFNHNGHWIGFGPDGKLYISTGDGGYANDWGIGHHVTMGNGQDLSSLQGKILRIDVDARTGDRPYGIPSDNPFVNDKSAKPEIWAYGLRNPWRCSFDTGSKQLFCGDVQQNSYEEVSIVGKGQNLGWRRMEANHCFDYAKPDEHPASCDTKGLTPPILEYNNCTAKPQGCRGISVTGGYVYQGKNSAWKGKYIFGDWSKSFAAMDGQIFIATRGGDGKWTAEVAQATNMPGKMPYMLAFAQDEAGEIYALTSVTTGPNGSLDTIYRIVPAQ